MTAGPSSRSQTQCECRTSSGDRSKTSPSPIGGEERCPKQNSHFPKLVGRRGHTAMHGNGGLRSSISQVGDLSSACFFARKSSLRGYIWAFVQRETRLFSVATSSTSITLLVGICTRSAVKRTTSIPPPLERLCTDHGSSGYHPPDHAIDA